MAGQGPEGYGGGRDTGLGGPGTSMPPTGGYSAAQNVQGVGMAAEQVTDRAGSEILLNLTCRDLIGLQGQSPRSLVIMYLKTFGVHDWKPIGRTEAHPPSSNPDYSRGIAVTHHFERYQELRLAVFETFLENDEPSTENLIGSVDVVLGRVLAAEPGNPFRANLQHMRSQNSPGLVFLIPNPGTDPELKKIHLNIHFENFLSAVVPQKKQKERLLAYHRKHGVENKKKPQPETAQGTFDAPVGTTVLVVMLGPNLSAMAPGSEASATGSQALTDLKFYEEVYRSSPLIRESQDDQPASAGAIDFKSCGKFPEIVVSSYKLNQGQDSRMLYLAVHENDVKIGGMYTSLSHLLQFSSKAPLSLDPSGRLLFESIRTEQLEGFTDILAKSEVDLNLMFAVDFTASNGNPADRGTLHSMLPGAPNVYEAVIRTMGNIVGPLCESNMIPAYGFGAKIPPQNNISHCFALSGTPERYMVQGLEQLIQAYKASVSRVQLHGPTIFSEVLDTCAAIMSRRMESGFRKVPYMVLFIITDGVLSDGDTFLNRLVHTVCHMPVSVVILGVGNEDFSRMAYFLGNGKELPRTGNVQAIRNNLTFVTLKEVENDLGNLAAKALSRIPEQVTEWLEYYNQRQQRQL